MTPPVEPTSAEQIALAELDEKSTLIGGVRVIIVSTEFLRSILTELIEARAKIATDAATRGDGVDSTKEGTHGPT